MKEIKIIPVLNGFIVEVGCCRFVFTDITKLTEELIRYQSAPEQVEREYLDHAINKMSGLQQMDQREPRVLTGGGAERQR